MKNRLEPVLQNAMAKDGYYRMKRVYIAGAMTNTDTLTFLNNLAIGIKHSVDVLKAGYAPFSPFIDFQYFLSRPDCGITLDMIQSSSIAYLMSADALYVIPGYGNSKGTLREIQIAKDLWIPTFYSLDALKKGLHK